MSRKDIKDKRQEKIRHIVQTAMQLFSEKGYAGASTNEIAELAGMSKRSMYYYVGDKDTLYATVVRELQKEVLTYLDLISDEEVSAEQKLHEFVRANAKSGSNRNLQSIVLRELFAGGEFVPSDIADGIDRAVEILRSILEQGEKESGFARVDPVVLFMMSVSFFAFWTFVTPFLLRHNKQNDNIAAFGENVTDVLVDEFYRMIIKLLKTGDAKEEVKKSKRKASA